MKSVVGRDYEKSILEGAFRSEKAEFITLVGRRRVGKTYLIRNMFKDRANTTFCTITGSLGGKTQQQITDFFKYVASNFFRPGRRLDTPNNWHDAFDVLANEIKISSAKKIVLFFDEFPWMDTKKSEMLRAFAYFWNHHASDDARVKLIICGSSAGWIINKVINDRGALYNRVTERIFLDPFLLYETKKYLTYKGITMNNKQIIHSYMVLGGIPFYLDKVKQGVSAIQAIADLAFRENSFLLSEFENLYATLFDGGEKYIQLARIIAEHRYGIGHEELAKKASFSSSGGTFTSRLNDLEKAGFIERFKPFCAKKKGVYYKMIDEYSLFYFRWIEPVKDNLLKRSMTKGYWEKKQHTEEWRSWAGYAFESICYKHMYQVIKALRIPEGSEAYSWRYVPVKGSLDNGAQIDMLFDRDDDMITVCEIKFTQNPFILDKEYAKKLALKLDVFTEHTKTKKDLQISFISVSGLKETMYADELVASICTLNDLFMKGEG
jgi:uncharacterized protein